MPPEVFPLFWDVFLGPNDICFFLACEISESATFKNSPLGSFTYDLSSKSGIIGDYTFQLSGIINHKDPGSLLNNQYFMESIKVQEPPLHPYPS